jgi:hypothetical protein
MTGTKLLTSPFSFDLQTNTRMQPHRHGREGYFLFSLVVFLCFGTTIDAQQVPIGTWRDHLPYNRVIAVTAENEKAIVATPHAVFLYDINDNSIERWTKANKLSDTRISALGFSEEFKTVVVGYENGNLDLITGGAPFNLNDIRRSSILADKRINNISFRGNLAYLATGFGIVVIDMVRQEVRDTYVIGDNGTFLSVNHVEIDSQFIYASTPDGIRYAPVDHPFLANFQVWEELEDVPMSNGVYRFYYHFGPRLYTVLDVDGGLSNAYFRLDSEPGNWQILEGHENAVIRDMRRTTNTLTSSADVFARVYDIDGNTLVYDYFFGPHLIKPNAVWVTDQYAVLTADDELGLIMAKGSDIRKILPGGPRFVSARRIDAWNNNFWVASGGVDQTWTNQFHKWGFYGMVNESWRFHPPGPGLNDITSVNDIMDVAIDPIENMRVAFGSWEEGLIVRNGTNETIYNPSNSTLRQSTQHSGGFCMVAGVDYDRNGNLWISNSNSDRQLHVMKPSGEFRHFSFPGSIGSNRIVSDVLAAQNGYVWMVVPRGHGLLVFNPNGTLDDSSDDDFRFLTNVSGQGGLPNNDIYCVEEDLDGQIWVGTLEGVAVYYNPSCLFSDEMCDAQQILIEQDGNIQILLGTETINAIKIDGANRKWIATQGSGVFLLSPDGLTQIHHFAAENSPLLSNIVFDIAINHSTGEVFFATDAGIIAYQGSATNFVTDIEKIKVFPNPVTSDYEGVISIDGLAYKTNVKITDISGNLVFHTISEGGRATWDGRNFRGEKVASGVYLIFATNADGSAKNVGKIAFVR